MTKCKGGCQMKAGGKTCAKCGCDMDSKKEKYEDDDDMKSGGRACMKCGGKMHKSGGTISSCMKCGGGKYTFGGKTGWSKKKVTDKYASGGTIKSLNNTYNIGGEINPRCPPGYMWNGQTCVEATFVNDFGGETPDYRYYMMDQIPGINKKQNPIKYYEQGDPEGIKAKQMYSDSLALHHKTQSDVSNFQNYSLPNYQSIEKGSWTDLFGNTNQKIKPVGQFRSPRSSCNKDGVCIDVYPKPVQPIEFKNKSTPKTYEMNPKETVGYKISELTNTNNTSNDRKELASNINFEKKTGRPYSGTIEDNVFLYDEVKKTIESRNKPTATPVNKIEQELVNTENTYEPLIIQTPDPGPMPKEESLYKTLNDIKYSPEDIEILGKLKGKGLWRGAAGWVPLSDQQKIEFYKRGAEFKDLPEKDVKGSGFYSFGGAISSVKKYQAGGVADNTSMTSDTEIQLGRGAFNVSEPAYDANKIMSRVFSNALSLKENDQPATKQTGYKEEVEKNKVVKDDKSLPNWGRAKKEQQILNELIRKDISSGKRMPLLVEDDIIGEKTLGAMRAYEASGQYTRPELFKDKWLAEYKKQWDEMQKSKSSAKQQETKTETQIETETQSINPNTPFSFFSSDWGKLHNDTKSNTKANTTPKGKGWPKEQLLKEGGVEISTSELVPKDFDTYQPIKGVSKSKKGVRATGRDNSYAYFDAAEKAQTYEKDGKKVNTSLDYIAELLSKSKRAIVIPKGQDKYGRDINDIYLQDEINPDRFHALDSSGVVKGEAIYGQWKTGEEGKMTDRQKMITGQAQEQGGFKYELSPWLFRETEKDKKSPTYKPSEEKKLKDLELSKWKTTKILEWDRNGKYTNFVVKDPKTSTWKVVQIKDSYENLKGKEKIVTIDGKEQKLYIDPKLYK